MSFLPQKCPDGQCSLVITGEEVFCEYCHKKFMQCLPDEDGVCNICGLPVDENNICLEGHHLLAWYVLDTAFAIDDGINLEEEDFIEAWQDERRQIKCQSIGYRCSICGAYFGDDASDDICQNGHEIGQEYPV